MVHFALSSVSLGGEGTLGCEGGVTSLLVSSEVGPDSSFDATNMTNSTIKFTNVCSFSFKPTNMGNSSFVTYLSRLGLASLHQDSEVTLAFRP